MGNLDKNQRSAVFCNHDRILVAAGAGTGKTEVMTRRIVRIIEQGAQTGRSGIESFLVLTFTSAATEEMKGRIESKLRTRAKDLSLDAGIREYLLEQAAAVDRAHIQTFHAFCYDIMREFHHLLDGGATAAVSEASGTAPTEGAALTETVALTESSAPSKGVASAESSVLAKKSVTDAALYFDPDARVLSEFERDALLSKAWDEVIDDMPGGESQVAAGYRYWDKPGAANKLKKNVLELITFAENDVDFEKKLENSNLYSPRNVENFRAAAICALGYYENEIYSLVARYRDAVQALRNRDADLGGALSKQIQKYDEHIDEAEKRALLALVAVRRTFDAICGAVDSKSADVSQLELAEKRIVHPSLLKNAKGIQINLQLHGQNYETTDALAEDLKKINKQLGDVRKELLNIEGSRDIQLAQLSEYADALISLAKMTKWQFQKLKRQEGAIDFSDQEHIAFAMLTNPDMREVFDIVTGRLKYIFVDENQDTSAVQNMIVERLASRGAHLFRVGDVKQCIYAFRNADPSIFKEQLDNAVLPDCSADLIAGRPPGAGFDEQIISSLEEVGEEVGEEGGENAARHESVKIPLNSNYRTVQPVLDYVNEVFRKGMPELYKGADLVSGRKTLSLGKSGSSAGSEQHSSDRGSDHGSDHGLGYGSDRGSKTYGSKPHGGAVRFFTTESAQDFGISKDERQAEIVAREIAKKVESGAKYGDFAILFRSLPNVAIPYQRVFARYGIPLAVQTEGSYSDIPEINLVLAVLRGIFNPCCDADFVAAATSPFFYMELDDFAELSGFRKRGQSFYALCMSVAASGVNPGTEGAVADAAAADIGADFYMDAAADVVADAYARAEANNVGADAYARAEANTAAVGGELRRRISATLEAMRWLRGCSQYMSPPEFIWKLYERREFFDRLGRESLANFAARVSELVVGTTIAEYVEMLRNANIKTKNALAEDSNTVKLMTMHNSKGMGFPHVFCANLQKKGGGVTQDLAFASKFGFAISGKNSIYNIIRKVSDAVEAEESMRLLYVAFTRAKDTLTLIADNDVKNSDSYYKFLSSGFSVVPEPYDYGADIGQSAVFGGRARLGVGIGAAAGVDSALNSAANTDEGAATAAVDKIGDISDAFTDGSAGLGTSITGAAAVLVGKFGDVSGDFADKAPDTGIADFGAADNGASGGSDYSRTVADPNFLRARTADFLERNYALEYGRERHRELELFDFSRLLFDAGEAFLRGEKNAADGRFSQKYSDNAGVDNFLKSDIALRAAKAKKIYKETEYVSFGERGKDQGVIDLFFVEADGGIVLIDYKTDIFNCDEDVESIRLRYREQLSRYARVLRQNYGASVRGAYLCLLHGAGRCVEVDVGV